MDLANWQVRNGHDVTMVVGCCTEETLLRKDLDPLVNVRYATRGSGKVRRYLAGLIWMLRNRDWIFRQDVLHAHLTFSAVMLTIVYYWRLARALDRPVLVETYHAVGMPIPSWVRSVHAWMAKRRDAVALMAEDEFWTAFRTRVSTPTVEVIPNGLPISNRLVRSDDRVSSYAPEAGIVPGRALVVGNVGRLVKERRPDLLVETLVRIAEADCRVAILLVGDGPERSDLKRRFAEAGLQGRVRVPGLALDPALPIKLMDLYISMNVGPITGLAGLQAALCGVPVVAIQLDEHYEPQPSDWIWSHRSPEKVAKEALRLLTDAGARQALGGRQAQYAATHFSVDKMGQAYDQLYRAGLASNARASSCAA